ncbi:MAG TPA: response regulator, partial [Candidatus Dormibacteraeota bacterium]|nr:response regulator [Candidatus Dormibacteraeota bacterium]
MNTPSNTARIVLVDDHPEVLRQTRELLEPQFEVVETLANGSQVEAAVARTRPDLLLLDITLPLVNGIEIATRLVRAGIAPRIVFLTVHEDVDYARAAMAAGAHGYVVNSRLASDLIP